MPVQSVRHADRPGPRRARLRALAWLAAIALGTAAARADDPPPPAETPDPSPSRTAPSPPTPSPTTPPAPKPKPKPKPRTREEELEERLRRMEEMNRKVLERYETLSKKYDDLSRRLDTATVRNAALRDPAEPAQAPAADRATGAQGTGGRTNPDEQPPAEGPNRAPAPAGTRGTSREAGGMGAQGMEGRTSIREADAKPTKSAAKVSFAEGISFASDDDEFQLSFHDLTQAEYRGFPKSDQGTLNSQFFIPRQRWYFTGRATKNVEFYTVINRGYSSLDLLDAFITLSYSEALRLRAGRMKTPFSYEYYAIAEGDLIAPERSVYDGNLSGNRQEGLMLLGNLAKNRIGYSMGIYNGPRRSFGDFNSAKDLFLYLNTRPFLESEQFKALNYLNLGGGVSGGTENNPTQPFGFHVANDQTSQGSEPVVATLSPIFFRFNNNVTELGQQAQWTAHAVWYYKSLMVLAQYNGGFQNYSNNGRTTVNVPYEGWFIQATDFITGEQVTRRVNLVKPLHDFGLKKGNRGIGAIEVHGRFAQMSIGKDAFAQGLADPNIWTNQVYVTDVGANWYLNFYTKIYLDWQHAVYGNPITTGIPGKYMATTNMFWLRFQLFF
ncbi:MAG TPA: porin [Isosphaeraceae bacterium]|jgi:phosphate-selective porin OprO/OprP|nr:porin [Isosphaeraceae bacterium]